MEPHLGGVRDRYGVASIAKKAASFGGWRRLGGGGAIVNRVIPLFCWSFYLPLFPLGAGIAIPNGQDWHLLC